MRVDDFARADAVPMVLQTRIIDARAMSLNRAGTMLAFCGSMNGVMGLWKKSLEPVGEPSLVAKEECWESRCRQTEKRPPSCRRERCPLWMSSPASG